MVQKEVTAKVPEKKDKEGKIVQVALGATTIAIPYGDTVEESIKMFGGEPMNTNAFSNWKVIIQSWIRVRKIAGDSDEAIQKAALDRKMGIAATGGKVDPQAAYKAMFQAADPKEQAKMLEELRAGAKK